MKKIVISGSSKLQSKLNYWRKYFKDNNYKILDFPKIVGRSELKDTYTNFYKNIDICDILFVMNEEKDGIEGYIGPNTFSELTYAIMRNQNHNSNIKIYLLNMPSSNVACFNEIKFFLSNNWISLFFKSDLEV